MTKHRRAFFTEFKREAADLKLNMTTASSKPVVHLAPASQHCPAEPGRFSKSAKALPVEQITDPEQQRVEKLEAHIVSLQTV